MNFADRLVLGVRAARTPLCVGLDPHLTLIPKIFRRAPDDEPTADDLRRFLFTVIDRVSEKVAVVKPQSAFYERLGSSGVALLSEVIGYARGKNLLVILDAKRNDIGSTASAYAQAYLGNSSDLDVDALTVNPYLGSDGVSPFVDACARNDKGMFVLAKTSNDSASELQDLTLEDGRPLFEHVCGSLVQYCSAGSESSTGWSSIGVVVGATQSAIAARVREILPKALFLVPGYGTQGASAREAVAGFVRVGGVLEGGVVSSSRSILFPSNDVAVPTKVWDKLFDDALSTAVQELSEAVS